MTSLRYGTIFKKAFSQKKIFTAFVRDTLGIEIEIEKVCPKYVNPKTPEPLQEWMRAIQDSLDEEVDESQYNKAEIQHVFEIIEKDLISPQERANMFEEYNQREAIRERGLQIARKMLAGGLSIEQVAQYADLSVEEVVALGKG